MPEATTQNGAIIEELKKKAARVETLSLTGNIYHRRSFEALVELESEMHAVREMIGQTYEKFFVDHELKEPTQILDASIKHWDKVLEGSENLPEAALIDYLQRHFQVKIALAGSVHIPTDLQEFQEGNGEKTNERGEDVNRVRMALEFLLHFQIDGKKITLDDIEIVVGRIPEKSSRKRPYWVFKLPEYQLAVFINNQYGNKTFVLKYASEDELLSLVEYTKKELKSLAEKNEKVHHFAYHDPGQFKRELAVALTNVHQGLERIKPYATYEEASAAAKALGIRLHAEYIIRYKEDPRLSPKPEKLYKGIFKSWGHFLRDEKTNAERAKEIYATYEEAKTAVKILGIQSESDYHEKRKVDPKLPGDPADKYDDKFLGWNDFTGVDNTISNPRAKETYQSYEEARDAARALGITSKPEYDEKYHLDPRLPGSPEYKYRGVFKSWPDFLGTKNISPKHRRGEFYSSYEEASAAAQALGINSSKEYRKLYKQDPKLASNPKEIYGEKFQDWDSFLGKAMLEETQ